MLRGSALMRFIIMCLPRVVTSSLVIVFVLVFLKVQALWLYCCVWLLLSLGWARSYAPRDASEACEIISEALDRRLTFCIVGLSQVRYEGRAESTLDVGDRIIIGKPDGSFLVHRPRGYSPVNWQPPGGYFKVWVDGDKLIVEAFRRKPYERVTVSFEMVYMILTMKLEDKASFQVSLVEEEMRKAILRSPGLIEPGFKPMAEEKHVESGFIDVYGYDRSGTPVVVEIKAKKAGVDAVNQLKRYIDEVKSVKGYVRGILAAPNITSDALALLKSYGLEYKKLTPRMCTMVLQARQSRLGEFVESEADEGLSDD